MLISSFYGDAFEGQFALRLKESARLVGIECDLFKWAKGGAEADKARLRSKLIARSLLEHRVDSCRALRMGELTAAHIGHAYRSISQA